MKVLSYKPEENLNNINVIQAKPIQAFIHWLYNSLCFEIKHPMIFRFVTADFCVHIECLSWKLGKNLMYKNTKVAFACFWSIYTATTY